MRREPRIAGLRRLLHLPGRIDHDVDEEIAFHIQSRVRDLVAEGRSGEEAQRVARAEFGDVSAARRELAALDRRRRRRRGMAEALESIAQDLRQTIRSLGRAPAFTLTAVATLVVGTGAVITMLAVVNGVLLRPLPYREPQRLVGAWFDMPTIDLLHVQQSAATYLTYRRLAHTIDDIGIYEAGAVNVADPASSDAPQRVTSAAVTAGLLPLLGVPPVRGRFIAEPEDRPHAAPVMLISERLWRTELGGDSGILGRRLVVDGVSREIIGVMPARFRFPTAETEIWIPLALDPADLPATAFSYTGVARLRSGVTITDAQRELAALLPRVAELFPRFVPGITTRQILEQSKPRPVLTPLRDDVTGGIALTLWAMTGAAVLLLLVAGVNVANLVLVRFEARLRELGVREALGAGRWRVARYLFTECAVLAGAAVVAGLALASVVIRALAAVRAADVPRLAEVNVDARVLASAIVIAGGAALACAAIPMLRVAGGALALRGSARTATYGRTQHRIRSALVAVQVALSVVTLAASGLLLRSFERLHAVHPGFDPDHVASLWVSLPRAQYRSKADAGRFYARLIDLVAGVAGVTTVGVASRLPFVSRGLDQNPLYPEAQPEWATRLPPLQIFITVGGDYFRTMRIPLLAGKRFDRMDVQRAGEAIVSRSTAALFWKDTTGRSALGKRFRALPTGPWYTVVGVVGDTRDTTLAAPPPPTVYFPELAQTDSVTSRTTRSMALVARTTGDPAAVVPSVRQAVHELDPTLPVFDVRPMAEALQASTARLQLVILMLGGAGAVTVVLGAIGLYGLMTYVVSLRRRELGIRIALGATQWALAAATTREGTRLTSVGVVIGVALFAMTTRYLRAFLFGVTPWDPSTIAGAALVLVLTAALATWLPARRAARVDPAEALRAE